MKNEHANDLDRREFLLAAAAVGAVGAMGATGLLTGCAAPSVSELEEPSPPAPVEPSAEPAPAPTPESSLPYDSVFPPHEPYGRGVGAQPGRVTWVREPEP